MESGSEREAAAPGNVPKELQDAVLVSSQQMPADSVTVRGHDFSEVLRNTDCSRSLADDKKFCTLFCGQIVCDRARIFCMRVSGVE